MDVVSEGNHDDWTYDPFTLTENQGYLYGRGAADMKSGLAALAIALIEIKESGKLTQELLNSWQQWVKKWNNQVRNSCLKKDMLMI